MQDQKSGELVWERETTETRKESQKVSLLAGRWDRKIAINSVGHPSKSSTKKP